VLATRPRWQVELARAVQSIEAAKRLWAAVLTDAISALRGRHPQSRVDTRWEGCQLEAGCSTLALWREAVEWTLSREAEPLGTFESVCAVLELSADDVRRDLCELAVQHAPKDALNEACPVASAAQAMAMVGP